MGDLEARRPLFCGKCGFKNYCIIKIWKEVCRMLEKITFIVATAALVLSVYNIIRTTKKR